MPDLEIAPQGSYIILETDGCMEGWGGVCKWKPYKNDPRSSERICAYASGKFPVIKSTIDAEIYACMETLKSLKIHYLDKKEITLRRDCQAIISFYNKSAQNKPSLVRWINFIDFVTEIGVDVHFEHIDGKLNVLVDSLSRLTNFYFAGCLTEEEETNLQSLKEAITEAIEAGMSTAPLDQLAAVLPTLLKLEKLPESTNSVCKGKRGPLTWTNTVSSTITASASKESRCKRLSWLSKT